MGKCVYAALIVVFLGSGLLIGGIVMYFIKHHIDGELDTVTAREVVCFPQLNFPLHLSSSLGGHIVFSQPKDKELNIMLNITGLPSRKLGFHIHTYGVTGGDCASAGGHFNPGKKSHGGPNSEERHLGDLGNIDASKFPGEIKFSDSEATLFGDNSIIGRSVVIHEMEDDLKDQSSAGKRLACCTIQWNKL